MAKTDRSTKTGANASLSGEGAISTHSGITEPRAQNSKSKSIGTITKTKVKSKKRSKDTSSKSDKKRKRQRANEDENGSAPVGAPISLSASIAADAVRSPKVERASDASDSDLDSEEGPSPSEDGKLTFEQRYMRQITAEFADDIDALRDAADFKANPKQSLRVLVDGLRMGMDRVPVALQ